MEGLQGHGGRQRARMEEVILEPSFGAAIQAMAIRKTRSGLLVLLHILNSVTYLGT